MVTREDLGTFYYYQPALQRVGIVDVKVPKDLKVGYIMGAGDDIPTVLEQIGMNVTMIPADKLATEDLSKYPTIVLGIRAYDTQKNVATTISDCSTTSRMAGGWWCNTTPWDPSECPSISMPASTRRIPLR